MFGELGGVLLRSIFLSVTLLGGEEFAAGILEGKEGTDTGDNS